MSKYTDNNPEFLLGIGVENSDVTNPLPFRVFGDMLKRAGVEYDLPGDSTSSDVIIKLQPQDYQYLPEALTRMVYEERHGIVLEGKDKGRGMKRIEGIQYLRNWLLERFISQDSLVIKQYPIEDYRRKPQIPESPADPYDTTG